MADAGPPPWEPDEGRPAADASANNKSTARELVKVSMNFTPKTIEVIRGLARRYGTTMTEVVRRGVGLQKFVAEETEKGSKLLVEDTKGQIRRVFLP